MLSELYDHGERRAGRGLFLTKVKALIRQIQFSIINIPLNP